MKELSYQLGLLIGSNLSNQVNAEDMDILSVARGIEDMLNGNATNETLQKANTAVQSYMRDVQTIRAQGAATEGKTFLAENGKREGVVTRPSGLQYEVLKAGTGKVPTATNKVVAHYEGRLLDGLDSGPL